MDEQDMKKFGEIMDRFRKLKVEHREDIRTGGFLKMIWSGIIEEALWLGDALVDAYGEPPAPKNEDEPKKTKRKIMKGRSARLAKVAANRGTDAAEEFEVEASEL